MISRNLVDAELLPLIDAFPEFELSRDTLSSVRARELPFPVSKALPVETGQLTIRASAQRPAISVRIYSPRDIAGHLPAVLHLHGGGFVMGSSGSLEGVHQSLVHELQCVLVSVDYRLAPETVFPGAVEDAYAALAFMVRHGAAYNIIVEKIGVMGESAGGGLAAALALLTRDRAEFGLSFQHLIYPMLDDRTCLQRDAHPFAGEFIWQAADNHFGWSSLLGGPPGSDDVSPYAAPARATDLTGLPPTFIGTGALDLFVDENIDFARRLGRAGVPIELHVYPGAVHGFDLMPNAEVAMSARRDSIAALRRFLHGRT